MVGRVLSSFLISIIKTTLVVVSLYLTKHPFRVPNLRTKVLKQRHIGETRSERIVLLTRLFHGTLMTLLIYSIRCVPWMLVWIMYHLWVIYNRIDGRSNGGGDVVRCFVKTERQREKGFTLVPSFSNSLPEVLGFWSFSSRVLTLSTKDRI